MSSLFLGFRARTDQASAGWIWRSHTGSRKPVRCLAYYFRPRCFRIAHLRVTLRLTVMIGGTRQPELAALPTEQLLSAHPSGPRRTSWNKRRSDFVRHTFWPRAIPQYNVGHEQYLSAMAALESDQSGLVHRRAGARWNFGAGMRCRWRTTRRVVSSVRNFGPGEWNLAKFHAAAVPG